MTNFAIPQVLRRLLASAVVVAVVTVVAAAASQLMVTTPPSVVAGAPFAITVTALDPFGNVAQRTLTPVSGTQQVTPTDSITYHLVAKGSGGNQEASTRLTVTPPPVWRT